MAIDITSPRSRRAILIGAAGGAVAAAVSATMGRASSASAADGDTVQVGHQYSATNETEIDAAGNTDGFQGTSVGGDGVIGSSQVGVGVRGIGHSGNGVYGSSVSSTGVQGYSASHLGVSGLSAATDAPAVQGWSIGDSTGVLGYSSHPGGAVPAAPVSTGVYGHVDRAHGLGVYGRTTDTTSETYGVYGRAAGSLGRGVFGWGQNESSGGTGVWGQSSSGTGVGVRGYAWDGSGTSGKFGTGVMGTSGSHAFPPPAPLANVGVYGIGVNGRGLVGRGDKAQLRLVPSAATTHPVIGAVGDLFLDASARLWLCKGKAAWVQLG